MKKYSLDQMNIDGVEFRYGEDATMEYFEHIDPYGWYWRVFKRKARLTNVEIWEADVTNVESDDYEAGYMLLTSATLSSVRGIENKGRVQIGPLGNVDGRDLDRMIRAIIGLIKKAEWPEGKMIMLDDWRREYAKIGE